MASVFSFIAISSKRLLRKLPESLRLLKTAVSPLESESDESSLSLLASGGVIRVVPIYSSGGSSRCLAKAESTR